MSFVLLGILNSQAAGGGAAIKYFLSTLGDANNNEFFDVAYDADANIYSSGKTRNTSDDGLVVKYDAAGTVQWQKVYGKGPDVDSTGGVAISSSNDVYVAGRSNDDGDNVSSYLAKLDSNGTPQWQEGLYPSTASDVAIDSNGDIIICGKDNNVSGPLLAKYNSSGTLQWQRTITGNNANHVAVDSSNNIYTIFEADVTSIVDFVLVKYNSSGTLQWQRYLARGNNQTCSPRALVVDGGNVYVAGYYVDSFGPTVLEGLIAKYNSGGTLQWKASLGVGEYTLLNGAAVDSSGNLYVAGYNGSASVDREIIVAKYNSSGTIQWQRSIDGAAQEQGYEITISENDDIALVGFTESTGEGGLEAFLAQLPNDGSLTGTYSLGGNNLTYAASTLTTGSAPNIAGGTSSRTASTASLSSATFTFTYNDDTLTQNYVEIG